MEIYTFPVNLAIVSHCIYYITLFRIQKNYLIVITLVCFICLQNMIKVKEKYLKD